MNESWGRDGWMKEAAMLPLRSEKEVTGAEGSLRLPRLRQNEGSGHGWKISKIPSEPCRDILLAGSVCPE